MTWAKRACALLVASAACCFGAVYAVQTGPATAVLAERLSLPGGASQGTGLEQAIVVLTGTPERLDTAAALQRATRLPLIISGAIPSDVADVRKAGGEVPVIEKASRDTEQNAAFTHCVAREHGVRHVYLVTDALHMRRATAWFTCYGFAVTPVSAPVSAGLQHGAPTPVDRRRPMHEMLGLVEVAAKTAAGWRLPCGQPVEVLEALTTPRASAWKHRHGEPSVPR